MKHHVSKFLKSVSVFYLAFPVAYIVISAILFDIPASGCVRILLSPVYYLVTLLAMTVGYGLWEVKRWVWYAFVVVNFLIGYLNAIFVNEYGVTQHKMLAFAGSVLLLLILTYRVAREIRVPYFFPKIRWWESNPRYRLAVPVKVARVTGDFFEAQILDLSQTGCFVKLRSELVQDEPLTMNFTIFGNTVACTGVVVWRTSSTVTHPKGVGVKFTHVSKAQKRQLRLVNQRLKKIAVFYRRSRYLLNQDDFVKRLEELEKKGAGRLSTG